MFLSESSHASLVSFADKSEMVCLTDHVWRLALDAQPVCTKLVMSYSTFLL